MNHGFIPGKVSAVVFSATPQPPSAAVVVVHGLNTKPEIMDELIGVLVENGFGCVRVSLHDDARGARTPPAEVVSAWVDRVELGILEARRAFPNAAVDLLGVSTGAMASLALLDRRQHPSIDRMFLLAPPVALRLVSKPVRVLIPLWRLGLGLPSAAPRSVRQRSWTPFSEYGALMLLHDHLKHPSNPRFLAGIRTRIEVDSRDELVDLRGVDRWLDDNDLREWSAQPISGRDPQGRVYRHLVVTRAALGPGGWRSLVADLLEHLRR
ncbi:MAG: alpha/beta hydrolase [Rhodococcus sp. (in: high G+C Gram-positive bacteria)]